MEYMSVEERIKYYMGKWYDTKFLVKSNITNSLPKTLERWHDTLFVYRKEIYSENSETTYFQDFQRALDNSSQAGKNWPFLTQFGDMKVEEGGLPIIIGHRRLNTEKYTSKDNPVIMKIDATRHWGVVSTIDSRDSPWEKKMNNFIWRGITTGLDEITPREKLVKKHFNPDLNKPRKLLNKVWALLEKLTQTFKTRIFRNIAKGIWKKVFRKFTYNIGYSQITQGHDNLSDYVIGFYPIINQLLHKFLISIEGNDVASNLKWALYSKSTIIMPKPTVECWLMEGKLEPYVHYIPLNDECDNLEEILEWAEKNDDKCKEIAENATEYVKQFLDPEREMQIMVGILEKYSEKISFE
jgi:glycosyl transferase family 90